MTDARDFGPFWALVSGGKDSVAMAHVLASSDRLAGVAFIDTGIACPDTMPFVADLCSGMGWPLRIVRTPVVYEDLVMRYGFPGPAMHSVAMSALKARAIRVLRREVDGVVLASGVRAMESARRSRTVRRWGMIERTPIFAPIHDWSTERVWSYLRGHDLPVSPAYASLHMSGDCLCGAFAERDEPYLLRIFYPDVADRIARLEARLDREKPSCPRRRWGGSGGVSGTRGQTLMESFLCQSCTTERAPLRAPRRRG